MEGRDPGPASAERASSSWSCSWGLAVAFLPWELALHLLAPPTPGPTQRPLH